MKKKIKLKDKNTDLYVLVWIVHAVICYTIMCVLSLSCTRLFVTPQTVAHQSSLSTEFSRQEYQSGQPFPTPGDLPNSRIEPRTPAFQADSLLSKPPEKPTYFLILKKKKKTCVLPVFKDTLSISEKGPCMYKGDCKEAQFEGD